MVTEGIEIGETVTMVTEAIEIGESVIEVMGRLLLW